MHILPWGRWWSMLRGFSLSFWLWLWWIDAQLRKKAKNNSCISKCIEEYIHSFNPYVYIHFSFMKLYETVFSKCIVLLSTYQDTRPMNTSIYLYYKKILDNLVLVRMGANLSMTWRYWWLVIPQPVWSIM